MRVALVHIALAAPLAFAAVPAQAQTRSDAAGTAIVQGDYPQAERELLAEIRIHPGRPELLLNLAAVYARTGRQSDARALYRRVLAQDEVLMDLMGDRIAGSHAIARTGLRRLDGVQVTANN